MIIQFYTVHIKSRDKLVNSSLYLRTFQTHLRSIFHRCASFGVILEAELLNDKKNHIYAHIFYDYYYSNGTGQIEENS
jgi:hypothetical protein